jgi:hypothetical protein
MTGPEPPGSRRRGQVLVVGGVLFALALLALATVLNAAVFTGELATRRGAAGTDRAVGYQHAAERSVGGEVFYANYHDYGSRPRLARALAGRVGNWSEHASVHHAATRALATTQRTGVTNGSYAFQAGAGAFTDADGAADWVLADDVTGVRRFSLNVSRDALAEPMATDTLSALTDADPFRIRATNGSATAEVLVYADGDEVVVQPVRPDDTLGSACAVAGEHVTVAVTAGTVGGEPCEALDFPGVTGSVEVAYRNGDAAAGRYGLVTDVPAADIGDAPYAPGTTGAEPHVVPAVYAVTVDISYTTGELRYTTTERVAPEAPPGPRVYGVAPGPGPRELVFVDPADGGLRSIARNGSVTAYEPTGVQAIGPMTADLDGDDRLEIPYVDSSDRLRVVDGANETRTVATDAASTTTLLGVGTWGNGTVTERTAVFYVDTTDGTLQRAWYDAGDDSYERQLVRRNDGDGDGIDAVAGITDYNADGDTDIVFTDGSALVTYIDGGVTHETDESVGQNNGVGVGEPHDFDADGSRRAPMVDGSGNVALLPPDGVNEDRTSSAPAAKSPVAGIDWDESADGLEVVFVDTSDGTLHYVTAGGDIVELTDASGAPVAADDDQGVA